jgi:hypothetical protein
MIKGLIGLKGALAPAVDPVVAQTEVLRELLFTARETSFGRAHGFTSLLDRDDLMDAFSRTVPMHDHDAMHSQWWNRIHAGEADVTWPGKPPYFALSSGTTGRESKRIPVTHEMLASIRKAGVKQFSALHNFDLPADFFEKDIMMLGSSTNLKEHNGHLEGEISGISASNIPFWFKGYYKPGAEIARIDDWDMRVHLIAERAAEWDVGALSGIPSWLELMMKAVIERHRLSNIHEIWPNLQVFASGGIAFEPYEKSFNQLLAHPITVIDTYFASEGFFACQTRPDTKSMELLVDNGIYYEFVPFQPEYLSGDGSPAPHAPVHTVANVKEGVEYVMLVSTVAGAWRYMIGDTITFTDVERMELRITGRTKFFLNVVGSQLSVDKMNDAMRHLEQHFEMAIPEFTVAAVRIDGQWNHVWHLGTQLEQSDDGMLAMELDEFLKAVNKNYAVARGKALKGVVVNTIPVEIFHEWSAASKKKGGQVKMERVMGEERYKEWRSFVEGAMPDEGPIRRNDGGSSAHKGKGWNAPGVKSGGHRAAPRP